jgi:hypothetical protein
MSTTVSLFALDLGRAFTEWRRLPAAPMAQARLAFDALVERHAAARLFDAPLVTLTDVCAALARAVQKPALELDELDESPPAYPPELHADTHDIGVGLRIWLPKPQLLGGAAAAAAQLGGAAAPSGADAALWADLAEAVAELLEAAAKPGMVVVGIVT